MSDAEVLGQMRLHLDLTITFAEMRTWSPERIDRFFRGLAAALAARYEDVE